MNVLKRKITWLVLPVVAAALYGLLLGMSPLPISVIDRDGSGVISLGEAISTIDVGTRPSPSRPSCTEYFWLKDGSPAFEQCPN